MILKLKIEKTTSPLYWKMFNRIITIAKVKKAFILIFIFDKKTKITEIKKNKSLNSKVLKIKLAIIKKIKKTNLTEKSFFIKKDFSVFLDFSGFAFSLNGCCFKAIVVSVLFKTTDLYQLDFFENNVTKNPNITELTRPKAKTIGANVIVDLPKIKKYASNSCARLETKAEIELTPINETLFFKRLRTKKLQTPDAKVLTIEKIKTYESSVPVIKA